MNQTTFLMEVEKLFNKSFILLLLFLCSINTSCNKDDEPVPTQEIIDYERSGILGGTIRIEGKNLEYNKLQVFFDLNEAPILSVSEDHIEVRIPRSIERYNPVLKIVNLITNEDILNETFVLKAPKINSFDSPEITFDEKLIINGENFDTQEDFLEVFVNNEKAQIVHATHDQIEIYIPAKITNASLEVTVNAQLQTTNSSPELKLKNPEISEITNDIAWLGGDLYVNGINFNPERDYGEVYINGIKSHFSSSNNALSIDIPYGSYADFSIINVTYNTAGLTSSFDLNLEIGNIGVMVDRIPNIQRDVIVYNNKGYAFTSTFENNTDSYPNVELYEFSPNTEKWIKIESFGFKGYLNDMIFDNDRSIYLYKGVADNTKELSKLDLSTFIETNINIPFHPSLNRATILVHQNDLFVLNGMTYENDEALDSDKRYRYISNLNTWEEITSDLFAGNNWKKGQITKRIYLNNDLYIRYFGGNTYKLDSNTNLTNINGSNILFTYNQAIVGRRTNIVNQRMLLYNIFDLYNGIELQFGRFGSSVGSFFTINDQIYYHAFAIFYDGKVELATYRIKKEKLNEIL